MVNTSKNQNKKSFSNYLKFLGAAIIILLLIDFIVFKGERPYQNIYEQGLIQEQNMVNKAIEESLPPRIVYPETGEPYFESPPEPAIPMAPEKSLNVISEPSLDKLEEKEKEKPITISPSSSYTKNPPPYKISIVIDDVGMNLKLSHAVIDLPKEITLAFLPYAPQTRILAEKAKKLGHELIIHAPMEAINNNISLGDMALLSTMNQNDLRQEFNRMAESFDGYVGINNHMGSLLTQNRQAMDYLMQDLKSRGLYFLDSKTVNTSVAAQAAAMASIPYATRDVFLDHEETESFVSSSLAKTEKIAQKNGYAIAIGHPKNVTIDALNKWIPTLESRGFVLVPLSEVLHKKSEN